MVQPCHQANQTKKHTGNSRPEKNMSFYFLASIKKYLLGRTIATALPIFHLLTRVYTNDSYIEHF